jgi:NMT1-like family
VATKDFKWPEKLKLVSGPGIGITVINSWGSLLTADAGVKIQAAPCSNTADRLKWTGLGLFDLTAGGTGNSGMMLEGEGPYAARDSGPFQLRSVWAQSTTVSGFFMRGDSNLNTPRDIKKGTRIIDMTYVASQKIVEGLLAWAGVAWDDITWVPAGSSKEKNELVLKGEAELAFGTPAAPSMYEAEKHPAGLKWLDCNAEQDPDGARRFLEVDPLIEFTPTVIGVPSSRGVWGAGGTSFYCGKDAMDAALVYNLAKWLDENWARYKDAHEWNQFMTRETVVQKLGQTFIPAHEGLVAYLRDIGLWSPGLERRNAGNIDLVNRYCEAFAAAQDKADVALVIVSPDNENWLSLWRDVKRERGIPPVRMFLDLDD